MTFAILFEKGARIYFCQNNKKHIKIYIVLIFGLQFKAHIINCIFSLLHPSEFLVVKGDANGVMGEYFH